MNTFQYLHHQCLLSTLNHPKVVTPSLQETFLQDQLVGLVQTPVKLLLFPLGPSVHKTLYVVCRNRVPVSLRLVEFLQSSPVSLQSQMLWGPVSDPQTREPEMGPSTLTPVGEPLQCNYFSVFGLPTW